MQDFLRCPVKKLAYKESREWKRISAHASFARICKPLAAVWDLAVKTVPQQTRSFSRLFSRDSLKATLGFCFKAFYGFKGPRLSYGVNKVWLTVKKPRGSLEKLSLRVVFPGCHLAIPQFVPYMQYCNTCVGCGGSLGGGQALLPCRWGGRRRSQHYIREWREASSLGLLGAGLRARRLRGAVRRPCVTLLSHWGVFLELWQLSSHSFHWLPIVCRAPGHTSGKLLTAPRWPFPENWPPERLKAFCDKYVTYELTSIKMYRH